MKEFLSLWGVWGSLGYLPRGPVGKIMDPQVLSDVGDPPWVPKAGICSTWTWNNVFFYVFILKMSLFPFWKGLRSQVRAASFAEENSCVVSPFTVKESDSDVNVWRVNVKLEMQEYVLLPWLHVWTQRMKTPHSHIQQYTNIHGPRACKYLTYLQMWSVRSPFCSPDGTGSHYFVRVGISQLARTTTSCSFHLERSTR